ncbi:MAG: ribosomal protein S18-alanine N-acetyltransferase [Clostridia bacterium]
MTSNLSQIKLSYIQAEDIKSVAQIEKECFSKPWSENMIQEKLENDYSIFIVAKFEAEVVGYIGASLICGECYVDNVAVTQKFRRMGVASMILDELITQMEQKDCELITLEVRKSNETAQKLYQMKQFEEIGERKNYYYYPVENAVIMTRYLKIQEENK